MPMTKQPGEEMTSFTIRQIKAYAYDRGYREGVADERQHQDWDTPEGPNRINPHLREGETLDDEFRDKTTEPTFDSEQR